MEFVKKEGFSDNAIAEFFEKDTKAKKGYILAEMGTKDREVVTKYIGYHFKTIPTLDMLRTIAAKMFRDKYMNYVDEFKPENTYYSDSRKVAIEELLCSFWVINIEDGSFGCVLELVREDERGELKRPIIARGIHRVHIKGEIGLPEIRKSIPKVGKVNVKACPFCGRIDLYCSPKEIFEDRVFKHFSMRCSCGASMDSKWEEERYFDEYEGIFRCVLDRWNNREGEKNE